MNTALPGFIDQVDNTYAYLDANYGQDIIQARQVMDDIHAETEDLFKIRNGLIAAAAAVYLYNILDIAFINNYPQGEPWKGYYFSTDTNHQNPTVGIRFEF